MPLGGQVLRAAEPLGQRGQREPGLLRPGQHGRGLLGGLVELVLPGPGLGHLLLQGGAPGQHGGLVRFVPPQIGGERHVVVGEQPQPRVPQLGLDERGLPGHLGLPAQRLETAAQLGGEVDEPGQVGLHRLQLAQRLLLALAVLQDAGRLLDEPAPVLRPRLQDRVELALADDDVHLPADAGVGEQLLDVQQPAVVAVDRVLALPGPEHQPAERDLGIVNRQSAVGVVDGQRHLGPAQRWPRGGAREDDVFHLAAAQRLGALLAHHPGQGVDDVGLARAVRPDHAGDAGLEAERGGGGEGLEAAQSEALQVQAAPFSSLPRTLPP